MEKRFIGLFGSFLCLYGIFSAIKFGNVFWYTPFTIGGTLFLGYLNYNQKNENILTNLEKNPKRILKIYLIYILMALIIEYIGRFTLNLWTYEQFTKNQVIIHFFLIGYPLGFSFIYESFTLIKKRVKSFNQALMITSLVNAFLHEIPNTFAWAWTYAIPSGFEIFKINIWVIIGWLILIEIPIIVNQRMR